MMALALCSLGAAAQSVTVVLNDNTAHKFGADYIKEITFQEATSGDDQTVSSIGVDAYSGGNVTLTFNLPDGSSLVCDAYGPKTALYLMPGEYTVASSGSEFWIDNSSYSYYLKDDVKTALASGTMTVANEGAQYTITLHITLADGGTVNATWNGELPSYSQYFDLILNKSSYNENPQKPGCFYVKFSDPDWKIEMALTFQSDPSDKVLVPGTYTFPQDGEMTFGDAGINMYSPSSSPKITDGVVTVEKEGEKYDITMNLVFDDGRNAHLTFSGEITGTPAFTEESAMPALRRQANGIRSIRIK